MSALATGLALWVVTTASATPADDFAERQAELDARAEALEERAQQLEELFEALEDQRESVEDLREELADEAEEHQEALAVHIIHAGENEELVIVDDSLRRSIKGERIAIGDSVRVEANEEVDEVVAVGGDVDVFGRVLGDATSFGGTVHVFPGADVQGNAIAIGGAVIVDEGAHVGGRVPLSATGELSLDLDEHEEPERDTRGAFGRMLHEVYSHLMFMLSFAGVGVLTVGLFPKRVGRIARAVEERPVRVAVLGGFVNLMLFAATFFMAITIIGLPVAALLGLFLALSWLFGFVGLCQAIGDRLPFDNPGHGRWLAFLVGTVVITFVSALGTLGFLTVIAASIVGMGAAFHTRLGGV